MANPPPQPIEAKTYDDEAWKEMCELGWAGIFIDEEYDGQGLGIVELVILVEELGYAPIRTIDQGLAEMSRS